MPASDGPVPTLCRYRIKPGRQGEFLQLLQRHWSTLHKAGLATAEPARLYRCEDKAGNIAFVEQFSWKTGSAAHTAHQTPEVMALWEPMGALCSDMEFWHAEPVAAHGRS